MFRMEINQAYSLIAGFIVFAVIVILTLKYFPSECAEFIRRLRSPSASAVKKQSEELLAKMNKNVAERKSRK
ncbi:hypothetical protein [Undibacterium oligocarboniphilum]|uniref:Uncharacterized protein n=1 Tax=Undibacterium oligocarboniphilum TaxID=666702 RepID=A0A850QG39_9BURK|nr:hypothetical protein [Undibacterium oligocarboniphilum]MBC3871906.1 hypothetical protein [Undibacterium oligocarboniphilum]NVO79472.1 hypothetical protein [Undibacterium oligocarboniphilum]